MKISKDQEIKDLQIRFRDASFQRQQWEAKVIELQKQVVALTTGYNGLQDDLLRNRTALERSQRLVIRVVTAWMDDRSARQQDFVAKMDPRI